MRLIGLVAVSLLVGAPPTSRPTTRPATRPAVEKKVAPKRKMWRAKEGSPEWVITFVKSIPVYKDDYIRELQIRIEELRGRRKEISHENIPMKPTPGGGWETDFDAREAQYRRMKAIDQEIKSVEVLIKRTKQDDAWLPKPKLSMTVGSVGYLGDAVKVAQVIDERTLLVNYANSGI